MRHRLLVIWDWRSQPEPHAIWRTMHHLVVVVGGYSAGLVSIRSAIESAGHVSDTFFG